MEIFGIIVLLAARAVASAGAWAGFPITDTAAFFIAAIVAIACGLAGDVMNDFNSGYILHSDPKAQWLGECIGGIVGAFVSLGVFVVLLRAYGPRSFGGGPNAVFPAPQAGAVAAMVGGIPNLPAFLIGLAAAFILYLVNVPIMTMGLGVYLPFYLSATAFVGGVVQMLVSKFAPKFEKNGSGIIIASGMLGGEAVVGVVIALCQAAAGLSGIK
jgi:uncharacterized oligopeptide transporter (OPT) family protein